MSMIGLPDKFWPIIFDNFFDNPDEIRDWGLHLLESGDPADVDGGQWPGYRSKMIFDLNPELANKIIDKILNFYFNLEFEEIYLENFWLQFHITPNLNKNKNNSKNKGWIHRDISDPRWTLSSDEEKAWPELAGLIYLTPNIERNSGTSLFDLKKDITLEDLDLTSEIRKQIHLGNPVDDKEAEEQWEKHRNCFVEKIRVENIYNRLIMYDAAEWHAANSYYTFKEDRLTLLFFMGGMKAQKWPLERIKSINT